MKPELTSRQRMVYNLRNAQGGMTYAAIGEKLGITKSSAASIYRQAVKKKTRPPSCRRIEETEPDRAAHFLDVLTHPGSSVSAAATASGLPQSTARKLAQRARTHYQPEMQNLRKLKHSHLLALLDDRILHGLEALDDEKWANANARDIGMVLGVLLEKRQLLHHEPTQILSIEERKQVTVLVADLMQEAQRRGLITQIEPSTLEAVVTRKPSDPTPL